MTSNQDLDNNNKINTNASEGNYLPNNNVRIKTSDMFTPLQSTMQSPSTASDIVLDNALSSFPITENQPMDTTSDTYTAIPRTLSPSVSYKRVTEFDSATTGYIFSFLDLLSLLRVRSTCISWRLISYQPQIWSHVRIAPTNYEHFTRIRWGSIQLITDVKLHACAQLQDADLSQFQHCIAIQILDLSYNVSLTSTALQYIAHLGLLQVLNLEGCSGLTNQSLTILSRFPLLHSLSLSYTGISDEGLGYVKNCLALEVLQLTGCGNITHRGIQELASLPTLFVLKLGHSQLQSDVLKAVSSFPAIHDLSFEAITLTDDYFEYLTQLKSTLRCLNVHECNLLTDRAFYSVSQLENLHALFFSYNEITDKGLNFVSTLRKLEILEMPECEQITDVGLTYISKLVNLEILDISGCYRITDIGVGEISRNLLNLKILHMAECSSITDAALDHISSLQNLTSLELNACTLITDAGIRYLGDIHTLTSISLNECTRISDLGLKYLLNLRHLQALCASGTGITEQMLMQFCGMSSLRELNIYACQGITPGALEQFRHFAPQININF